MSGARCPDLSIVIPAYRAERALDMTLRALANTETGPETFDVIVVDDGSEEPLRPVVDAYQQIQASYIRLAKNSGRAAARNAGASQARGKRLLFLDSDTYPLKGFVRGHATFGTGGREASALLGRRIDPGWRRLAEAVAGRNATEVVEAHEDDLRHLGGGEAGAINFMRHRAPWLYCYTNNLSVTRSTFTELGGFDEAFTDWGFEDVEFGYRLFLSRNRIGGFEYRPDITCMHLPQFRNQRAIGRASMRSIRYMKQKHPCFDVELVGTDVYPRVESKIRYYEDIFTGIRRVGLGLSAAGVTRLLPEAGQQKALWIGAGLGIADEGQPQMDHMRDASGQNLHLLGIDTPFDEQQFEAVINVDLWRSLTPQDLSLAITEGLRIGKQLLLVASARMQYSRNGLGMADLDYFADAYGFAHQIRTIKVGPDGRVLHITAQ
jgi:glycosyltransferase involved in cell wall biosynthesis